MQRKLIQASVILALLTGPAFAQNSSLSVPVNPQKPPPTQEEIEKQKAADRAYNAAIQKSIGQYSPEFAVGGQEQATIDSALDTIAKNFVAPNQTFLTRQARVLLPAL